jgi:hypothetical protein
MTGNRISKLEAIANLMPPGPFSLRVTCQVRANDGQTAELVMATPQGINPKILILDVVVHGRGGKPADIEARYDDRNYNDQYEQVTVRYMSESETVDIQRVH